MSAKPMRVWSVGDTAPEGVPSVWDDNDERWDVDPINVHRWVHESKEYHVYWPSLLDVCGPLRDRYQYHEQHGGGTETQKDEGAR